MSSVADSKESQGPVLGNTPRMAMFLWEINRVGENDGPKSIGSRGRKRVALIQLNQAQAPQAQSTWCIQQLVYIKNCLGKSPIVKKILRK